MAYMTTDVDLTSQYIRDFNAASKKEKPQVIADVLDSVRRNNPQNPEDAIKRLISNLADYQITCVFESIVKAEKKNAKALGTALQQETGIKASALVASR